MNTTDTLTTMFSHNLWANLVLFKRCAELNSEQLAASIPGSHGDILDTLEHITKAEQSYFSRISTGQMFQRPDDEPPMVISDMMDTLRSTGQGFVDWALKVQADDTVRVDWDGTPRDVPKTFILTQVINHATEHREQVKATLTELEIEPPDLSGWTYFDELDS